MPRISKRDYYLKIAEVVAERSPCLKLKFGSIIVKEDSIISAGYNGPARNELHCKECSRLNKRHGDDYDSKCPAVHSEENAIINAARHGVSVIGGIMYISKGKNNSDNPINAKPCYHCQRLIQNAGIKEVIFDG